MTVNDVAGRAGCDHEVPSDVEWVSAVRTPAAGLTSLSRHWCQSSHLTASAARETLMNIFTVIALQEIAHWHAANNFRRMLSYFQFIAVKNLFLTIFTQLYHTLSYSIIGLRCPVFDLINYIYVTRAQLFHMCAVRRPVSYTHLTLPTIYSV